VGKLGTELTAQGCKASFVGEGFRSNSVFDLDSPRNRDNCLAPFAYLRDKLSTIGVELNSPDMNAGLEVQFELHLNVCKAASFSMPSYVLLYESPQVMPINGDAGFLERYRRVFTWRDDLLGDQRFIKFNLPNTMHVHDSRGWADRHKLCCLIAENKSIRGPSVLELYSERVKTIKWFEQFAPSDFDLFGIGWDMPIAGSGLLNRALRRLHRHYPGISPAAYRPSYRGRVASKRETMEGYRFSICYENVRDLPGYITEKIWDSFFAGCLPVYWGASNVTTYIPGDCFIDRRQFADNAALYNFLVSMTESEYIAYQERIAAFLTGDRARLFSAEAFAETIVKTIASDLATAI
jgi:hypothetical protein